VKPDCSSAKRLQKAAGSNKKDIFSGPVSAREYEITPIFGNFQSDPDGFSLHFRLRGGEQDIRTLGTIFIGTRADVSVSYTESVISENPQRLPANRAVVLTSPV